MSEFTKTCSFSSGHDHNPVWEGVFGDDRADAMHAYQLAIGIDNGDVLDVSCVDQVENVRAWCLRRDVSELSVDPIGDGGVHFSTGKE